MRIPILLAAAITAVLLPTATVADDKPGKVERVTYRVTGLFAPDREKDLRTGFEELPEFKLVAVNFAEAEITLEFDATKLFPREKPERIVEIIDQKVRSVTQHTFGVKPRRTVPRDKLKEVVIPAAGLDCKACCLAAYEVIANVDGVYQATASFKEGRITALIDPTKTDKSKLEETLRKRGVDVGKAGKR